ncbi:MucR family transcriptional regulator [Neorhodopirellula pilleata]|uniref:ROS/MUCR transcriptional regulator protein n=1 Tax=Neorhodopirellula pilleata TaxID=2714738 RepID=A0A5C5ZP33_9BACT|nr:MucR family transcriptional regulator [Neorhodopirellula pilleata]TWT89224.1 ROS/MUCR transcriptional regulator protein [Neorhodopirellula pilleata]
MNRTQILRRIRKRFTSRKPLNLSAVRRDEPDLIEAVYSLQPYLGWKGVLEEAGIKYGDIRVEVRENVECRICGKRLRLLNAHLTQTHGITPEEYRDDYPNAELASESLREELTGRLHNDPHPDFLEHWEPIYTREYVLDRLHEYARQGYWMNMESIGRIDCSLIAAVNHHVKMDWDSSLRAIGVDPAENRGLVRDDDFTLDDFRRWLGQREQEGLHCTFGQIRLERDSRDRFPPMLTWALRRFGNWRAALVAAGADLSKPIFGGHQFLSERAVKAEIKRLKDADADLSHTAVCLLPQGTQLTSAGIRFFGRWEAALDAARVPKRLRGKRTQYETADDVRQAITARIEHQFPLSPLELYYGSRSDIELWKKSFKHFGSWRKAVAEAGGAAKHIRQARQTPFSTKAKVIAELRRRTAAGQLLARREMSNDEDDKQLYAMATGWFGSWQAAVRASGIDPKTYHEWNLNPKRKYTDPKHVLAAIRRRRREGHPLNARGFTHGDHQDVPLLYTARKLFGTLQKAIDAAGLDYQKIARKHQDYEAMKERTYRTYETKQEVIDEIQRRFRESIPLNYRAVSHGDDSIRDWALITAAKAHFAGDWDRALRVAGIDLKTIQPDWVRQRKSKLKTQRRTTS